MDLPRLTQDPTDPAFVQDPYPFYDRARAAGRVFLWEDYGMAASASYKVVHTALRDSRLGREPLEGTPVPPGLEPFYAVEAHSMLELEPPRHTRLRKLVARAFTTASTTALVPEIERIAANLISGFPDGPFDLLAAYAQPLPVRVIAHYLGVPTVDAPDLLAWSNAMVRMYMAGRTAADEAAAVAATDAFTGYLRSVVAERRKRPGTDLLSALIAARDDAEAQLSEDELIANVILLLNAGHEATVHSIGNGTVAVLAAAAQEAARAGAPGLTDEVVRYDPPLHLFTRWVYEPVTLGGHSLKRGDQIACLLAGANRDPDAYDDPARFWPERPPKTAMSFGAGIHFCVGAPLARIELQVALSQLFKLCPDLRLAERPRYADIYHFHGFERLMVQR